MNLDGSGQHEIGDLPYGDPNVSPDGATLLMLGSKDDDGRQQALFTATMSGGDVKQITSYALDAAGKSDWAPDGWRVIDQRQRQHPGAIGQRRHGAGRRRRAVPCDPLHRPRCPSVCRRLLAEREVDRVPPGGPWAVRALPHSSEWQGSAHHHAALRLPATRHRLGSARAAVPLAAGTVATRATNAKLEDVLPTMCYC